MAIVYKFKKNLYINLTNRCSNRCIFCNRKNLERYINTKLKLNSEPKVSEIMKEIKTKTKEFRPKEIVFCGFGEPLLRADTVIKIIKYIKARNPDMLVRLDTNGQAKIFYPKRNIASELRKAGLDKISISLNAHNKKNYFQLCRPAAGEKAFQEVINFIKECRNSEIETRVTFVESGINKKKCKELAKKLKVKFLFRKLIEYN